MATVSSRNHGGLPKPQRIVNPFDSDNEEPTTSSTTSRSHVSNSSSSSAAPSTRYTNPFDDDAKPYGGGHTKSKAVAPGHRVAKSSNPFDDEDDSPAKPPSKHVAKGNKIRPSSSGGSHSNPSSGSHDASNPFSDDYEVTSKPKTRGDSILDDGSLFADEETPSGKPAKERKSSTRAFAAKIVEGGARMKDSASSSLSNVKLPSLSSSSAPRGHAADEKTEFRRLGKAKPQQQSKELFGEPEPGYISTQHTYFSQSDQGRFQSQTVEELEQYAVTKSQDTTSSIKNAIRIAEDTKSIATTTLETLHTQGDQIRRTHETAVRVDEELGRVSRFPKQLLTPLDHHEFGVAFGSHLSSLVFEHKAAIKPNFVSLVETSFATRSIITHSHQMVRNLEFVSGICRRHKTMMMIMMMMMSNHCHLRLLIRLAVPSYPRNGAVNPTRSGFLLLCWCPAAILSLS